jgi:uncharacterized metal-binding protein YceD (DUF177 family)
MSDSNVLRVSDLSQNSPNTFDLHPDSTALRGLADQMGLSALRKLRFVGTIQAKNRRDWVLEAKLGATVVQPCVATLEPVTTRIDTVVHRSFLTNLSEPDEDEVEMPQDDTAEPLGKFIDPGAVMAEALALALPLYPRKPDAKLDTSVFSEPGVEPMRDEDARAFAGLAGLRDSLKKGN